MPNWLADYKDYTESTESPQVMHLWVGISTLAAAMRRNYYIPFGHIKLYPYTYVVLVGPPGVVQKSTTLSFGTNLLNKVNGIKLAPDATSPQKLIGCLEDAARNVPTPEGNEVHHCMTIASSEFASLINGPDSETMITWLTDLFDREHKFSYQTKTQGDNIISNPWVNLIACTTPSSLQNCLPVNTVGDGLTSRILFIYADKKDHLIPVPRRPQESLVQKLVGRLEEITTNRRFLTFTDKSLKWWNHFYTVDNEQWSAIDYRMIPYKARRHAHILKLAMILAVSYDIGELTIPMLDKAKRIMELTELNMPKAFGGMGENPLANHILRIAGQLQTGVKTMAQIMASNMLDLDATKLGEVIKALDEMGILNRVSNQGVTYFGIKDNNLNLLSLTSDTTQLGKDLWKIILEN